MSLIEDAKALVGMAPDPMGPYPCGVCGECPVTDFVDGHMVRCRIDHASTCPWLALPRIVAALEAAQALLAKSPWFLTIMPGGDEYCQFCLADNSHEPGCEWVGLVEAMRDAP